jgi:hypothetical protein
MTPVSDAYLRLADDVGLLSDIAGHRYVADEYTDPVTQTGQCLVEYCDAAVTGSQGLLDLLWQRLAERFPAARSVLLRAPADQLPPPPWRTHSTYLRCQGSGSPASAGLAVRPALAGDREAVVG